MNKINRYNLLGVVAVLMVSFFPACNNDTPDDPEKLALEFDSSINNENWEDDARTIKDSDDLSILGFSQDDEITVDAWSIPMGQNQASSSPNFMNGQIMTYNSSSEWEYSPLKYWSNTIGDRRAFFAYHLAGATNLSINKNLDNSTTGYPTITFTEANKKCDILATPLTLSDKSSLVNGKVPLQFRHIMARIKMEVRYWDEEYSRGDWDKIVIKNIVFWNYPKGARFKGFDLSNNPIWEITNYPTGSGLYVINEENPITIDWGENYTPLTDATQFHYPFVCKHADANNLTHVDNAKFGFYVYKEKADGTQEKLFGNTDYIEQWFDTEIVGGKSYTFKVTITPKNQVILDLESNWWNDTENNGDANFLQ